MLGSLLRNRDGSSEGSRDGSSLSNIDGSSDGHILGSSLGNKDGSSLKERMAFTSTSAKDNIPFPGSSIRTWSP